MNKTVLLLLTIVVASMTGGCSFLGNAKKDFDESTSKPLPRVKSTPAPVATPKPEEEEFADLEEEDIEPVQTIAGLIPTTDADARVRSIIRGRQDPFSVVSLVPKIEIEEEEEFELPQPRNNRNNRNNRQQNPIAQRNNNSKLPSTAIDRFKTELAQNVVISGLYESNGSTKLIVRAPEEDNSRYVEVGQYLSNGRVLVKSIDPYHFPTPLVILEQSGIEIAKTVGETPEDSRNRVSSVPTKSSDEQTLLSNISLELKDIQ